MAKIKKIKINEVEYDIHAKMAESSTKAAQDASGNTITTTYETKSDATAKLAEAKTYANNAAATVKNDLLNGAGGAYDTLKELGDLIDDNTDAIDALETIAVGKQDKITGAASSIVSDNLTASRALVSDQTGKVMVSPITDVELSYLQGTKSNVQTQLDNKADEWSDLGESVTNLGDTLTWDGNTEGKVTDNSGIYVKISDNVPTKEDAASGWTEAVTIVESGEVQTMSMSGEEVAVLFNESGAALGNAIAIIPSANMEYEGIVCPEAGIYAISFTGAYVSSFTIPGYNFTETTVKPVPEKYLPEHSHDWSDLGEGNPVSVGETLTWDGNTEGHYTTFDDMVVKVSDSILTPEDCANGITFILTQADGTAGEPQTLTGEEVASMFTEDGFVQLEFIFVVPYDGYSYQSDGETITFEEKGIYFGNLPGLAVVSSITVQGYNFVKPTVKIMPKKYMPAIKYVENAGTAARANNADSADAAYKLRTARTIATNLGSTSTASFDGSANVTPGVTGTLPITNGGTGATTASAALTNLGGVPTTRKINNKALSSDITLSMSDLSGTAPITKGGTGATTAAAALTNLGAVSYNSQTLTGTQKTQARNNIGACGMEKVGIANTLAILSHDKAISLDPINSIVSVEMGLIPIANEMFVHVSSKIPTINDLSNGYILSYGFPAGSNGILTYDSQTFMIDPDFIAQDMQVNEDGSILLGAGVFGSPLIAIVPTPNETFPLSGIWAMYLLTKFAIPGYDLGSIEWSDLGETTASVGDTLTWDGDTAGRDILAGGIYKVSNSIVTKEALANGYSMTVTTESGIVTEEYTGEQVNAGVPAFVEYSSQLYLLSGRIALVQDGGVSDPITGEMVSAGIYFAKGDTTVNSLTIPGCNFTVPVINKIPEKYLPDGIGGAPGSGLPTVSIDDNGSILRVVNGAWAIVNLPIAEEGEY